MSDFLVSLDPAVAGLELLDVLVQPYGETPPSGRVVDFEWGAVALIEDRVSAGQNALIENNSILGWVGDMHLAGGPKRGADLLRALIRQGPVCAEDVLAAIRRDGFCDALNGAFAVVLADPRFVAVITDPMASVQVYAARTSAGRLAALGTRPDIVARCLEGDYDIDPVSVCDFMNTGIACCPYTMHRYVRELAPGTVAVATPAPGQAASIEEWSYWTPPQEERAPHDQRALADAFGRAWQTAIDRRYQGRSAVVTLSGGMDSRLLLAAISADKHCETVTLCDTMNREARFARRVARAYRRKWTPLVRDEEYLGRTAMDAIRAVGCEGEWHHGHMIGFADRLAEMGADNVFTGLLMDNNFKGYYARDYLRVARAGGLLPPLYRPAPQDYANQLNDFCRAHIAPECLAGTVERRRAFHAHHIARGRESEWEWLDGYPFSQACDNTGWTIERRFMPLRLPVMDRDLLELAFRIPISLKADGRFFRMAALPILGPGANIPNANDGVKPRSGHLARLAQRAARKTETRLRRVARGLGLRPAVPHSWHDFQAYWISSPVLGDLRRAHAATLREFAGSVFREDPVGLLSQSHEPHEMAYRLLQLAVWRSLIEQYRPVRRGRLTETLSVG